MTTNQSSGAYGTRRAISGLGLALGTVAKPNPIVIAWRWRYELGLATVLIAAFGLVSSVGFWWGFIMTAGLTCLIVAWPPARRQVMARAWCVITPHRVRTGCAQAWIHSREGKIPVVLYTTAEPFGERVYLWCRAGVCSEDLIAAGPLLAAACWANEVHVDRHERFAHLLVLDVIRRPFTRFATSDTRDLTAPPSWPQADIPYQS